MKQVLLFTLLFFIGCAQDPVGQYTQANEKQWDGIHAKLRSLEKKMDGESVPQPSEEIASLSTRIEKIDQKIDGIEQDLDQESVDALMFLLIDVLEELEETEHEVHEEEHRGHSDGTVADKKILSELQKLYQRILNIQRQLMSDDGELSAVTEKDLVLVAKKALEVEVPEGFITNPNVVVTETTEKGNFEVKIIFKKVGGDRTLYTALIECIVDDKINCDVTNIIEK